LKESVVEAFSSGLQEIGGWLDFGGVEEDLGILESEIWCGGTQTTQDGRMKLIISLRWRLEEFLEQAEMALTFWTSATHQADSDVQDFLTCATALSHASPFLCAWRVCEPLEADIAAFVHRVCGGGSGVFTHEAAGNFGLLLEAGEEHRRQVWVLQDTLEELAAENLTMGMPRAARKGPPCAIVHRKALADGFPPAEAMAMANAASVPALASPFTCRGN
jgi:hypothetical protein